MRALLLALLALAVAAPRAQIVAPPDDDTDVGDDVRTPLPSASFGKAPVRLVYDHVTQRTTLEGPDGATLEAWERADGVPYAEVPTDRPVVVEVRNANALVYGYAVSASVAELRDAPPSCGAQARSFALAGGLLAGGSFSPGAGIGLGRGDSFEDFLDLDLGGVGALSGRRGALPSAELAQIRRDAAPVVARLEALAERLDDVEADGTAALVRAARLGDAEPVGPLLAAIQAQLEAAEAGLSDPARVPAVVDRLKPDAAPLKRLAEAATAVLAGDAEDPDVAPATDVVALAARMEAAAEDAAAAAAALQALALRVEAAREAATQRVTVRPGDDLREVAVEIVPADDPVGGAVPTRARTVRAYLGPRAPRGVGCALAVALTFSPRPTAYGVRFGDGALVDATDDGLRSSPAVLFEVAPPVVGSVLGLVGGLGLGESFAPDLYAGASLRLLRPVLLTGGAVWRRGRTLPDGLALGDVVADDPDFDEDRFLDDLPYAWAPSFFVGLSVAP